MSQPAYQKVVQAKSTGSTTFGTIPANDATLTFGPDLLDDTDFTSTGWRSRNVGLKDWSANMTVLDDPSSTVINVLRAAVLAGSRVSFRYLPNGTNGFSGTGYVQNFSFSGAVADLETIEVTIVPDSALSTV